MVPGIVYGTRYIIWYWVYYMVLGIVYGTRYSIWY